MCNIHTDPISSGLELIVWPLFLGRFTWSNLYSGVSVSFDCVLISRVLYGNIELCLKLSISCAYKQKTSEVLVNSSRALTY